MAWSRFFLFLLMCHNFGEVGLPELRLRFFYFGLLWPQILGMVVHPWPWNRSMHFLIIIEITSPLELFLRNFLVIFLMTVHILLLHLVSFDPMSGDMIGIIIHFSDRHHGCKNNN